MTHTETILTKTSSDGRSIRVDIGERLHHVTALAYLDGQLVASGMPLRLPPSEGPATHRIPGNPSIGLTDDEAATVSAALDALPQPEPEPARCERCSVVVDRDAAYSQREWGRLGHNRVPVIAHYCDACARLLHSIGDGEHSAMYARRTEMPDMTPDHKGDY